MLKEVESEVEEDFGFTREKRSSLIPSSELGSPTCDESWPMTGAADLGLSLLA